MNDLKEDIINHPNHYIHRGIETIDVIEVWTEDLEGIEAVCTANIIKYISRWNRKNGIQDLEKLVWYANHLIEHLKEKEDDEIQSEYRIY